mmetsp:Transcript_33670/g.67051  ORF Transcript_33670/g.67051 Transcript_33670/m.67051 type:complete len:203 (-) Transcript_33670:20-628(-)
MGDAERVDVLERRGDLRGENHAVRLAHRQLLLAQIRQMTREAAAAAVVQVCEHAALHTVLGYQIGNVPMAVCRHEPQDLELSFAACRSICTRQFGRLARRSLRALHLERLDRDLRAALDVPRLADGRERARGDRSEILEGGRELEALAGLGRGARLRRVGWRLRRRRFGRRSLPHARGCVDCLLATRTRPPTVHTPRTVHCT